MGPSTPVSARPEPSELVGTVFLEDGTRFDGFGFGAEVERVGEVVFTTGMVGYPESLTDPSYRGQLLVFTYPLLGNSGVPSVEARDRFGLPEFVESTSVQVRGMIVRGLTRPNHWAQGSRLEDWLRKEGIPGVGGIDTRRLTEHLRSHGVVRGVIRVDGAGRRPSSAELARSIRRAPQYQDEPLVPEVSPRRPTVIASDDGPLVALLDGGVKASIVRALLERHLTVLRLPYDHEVPTKWEGRKVRGLVVGNG
ncbi:MAG: carbamoyl-phosphate synthase small subunit, partial [Thermoplasmata archaeon]|nr:carbamoyl-phosphate synthase small subunit [Thermoplasmata archaeon]